MASRSRETTLNPTASSFQTGREDGIEFKGHLYLSDPDSQFAPSSIQPNQVSKDNSSVDDGSLAASTPSSPQRPYEYSPVTSYSTTPAFEASLADFVLTQMPVSQEYEVSRFLEQDHHTLPASIQPLQTVVIVPFINQLDRSSMSISTSDMDHHPLSVASQPDATFHNFPDLKPAIRKKIWQFAFPPSRVIELKYNAEIYHAISSTCPPVHFQVCQESRIVAKGSYRLLFNEHPFTPRIWIDPNFDTLYLSEASLGSESEFNGFRMAASARHNPSHEPYYSNYLPTIFRNLQPDMWSNISRIALNNDTILNLPIGDEIWTNDSIIQTFAKFSNLRNLSLVFEGIPHRPNKPSKLLMKPFPLAECTERPYKNKKGKYAKGSFKCVRCKIANRIATERGLTDRDSIWWTHGLQQDFYSTYKGVNIQHVPKLKTYIGFRWKK